MTDWTEHRVNELKRLVADGLSASQISAAFGDGCTKNAVIGKCHRIGLRLSDNNGRPLVPVPRQPRPRAQVPLQPIDISWPPQPLTARGNGCAFPVSGHGADTLYCAGPTSGERYCARHRAVMYEKTASDKKRNFERGFLWAAAR
jgi:hypothetical protein